MSAGNLGVLLLLAGGVLAVFAMHRGGGHAHGMSGGCGSHGHGNGHDSPDSRDQSEQAPGEGKNSLPSKPGSHDHGGESAAEDTGRGGF